MSPLSKVGTALMVIAFAILAFFIILPSILPIDTTPWLQGPYQALFCHGGETLSSEKDSYNPRPGETDTTTTTGCVDSQGTTRDISDSVITVGMVGYLAPFLIGLFLFNTGQKQKRNAPDTTYTPTYNGRLGAINKTIQRDGKTITVNRDGNYSVTSADGSSLDDDDVGSVHVATGNRDSNMSQEMITKLRTLKTAHDQGLITADEYESKRKELLNEL